MLITKYFIGNSKKFNYNSLGHRCKELSELNWHNYILFVGDEVGLGETKPVDHTFPFLIAQKLKMDYYNLCVKGGGLEILKLNLINWINTCTKLPKTIVIVCKNLNEILISDNNFQELTNGNDSEEYIWEIKESAKGINYWTTRIILADKLLRNYITVPTIEVIFQGSSPILTKNVTQVNYNFTDINDKNMTELITNYISIKQSKAKP